MANSELIQVESFTGKYFINEAYRPVAAALVKKYKEINHIIVGEILFIEDTEGKKKKNGQTVLAQIGLIPEKWDDVIYQLTGKRFGYMMEIYKNNIYSMSREQVFALIYHELRHIGAEGKLVNHDIEDWVNMVEKLGVDWNTTRASIPNLLDEDVDWESITGPATLFPAESTLRVVK